MKADGDGSKAGSGRSRAIAISRGPQFSQTAERLAGIAGALLGWRPDEFWAATPAELAAVLSAMAGDDQPTASADDLARLKEMFPDG